MGGVEIPQRRVSCTIEVCYPFPGGQEADQVRMKRRAFITLAQGSELRLQLRSDSRLNPGCGERNFWVQRQSTKYRLSSARMRAETTIRKVSGRKSPQKRPIWRRPGNVRFAKAGWWWKQSPETGLNWISG